MNSAIELAQYIYDTIDVDKVNIEELFSFSKTRDLLNYIYEISNRDVSTIELANIKSRLQIIEKYMDDFPSTIYVDRNLNENSIEYEINSSALIVLYIVFFILQRLILKMNYWMKLQKSLGKMRKMYYQIPLFASSFIIVLVLGFL